jgi:hypothetical protein
MAVTQTQLTQLYLAYFGRPPDFDGLVYYTTKPNLSIWDVAASFSASPESVALYGGTFNASEINAIYQNLFNRDAEPAGLLYWSQEVALGHLTPAGAALAILLGAQNADLTTVQNKLAVATAFDGHLDTAPEIIGYTGTGAAGSARDFLHTVTSDPATLTAAMAALDDAIAAAVALGGAIGPSFTLSQNVDTITITDATTINTIHGIIDGGNSTYSVGDAITGNGKTIVDLAVASTTTAAAFATLTKVSQVNITAAATGSIDINAVSWSGIGSVNLNKGMDGLDVFVNGLNKGAALSVSNVAGSVSASYTNDVFAWVGVGTSGGSISTAGNNVVGTVASGGWVEFSQQAVANSVSQTVGNITITGSGGATVGVSVSNTQAKGGDITVGNVSLAGAKNVYFSITNTSHSKSSAAVNSTVGNVALTSTTKGGHVWFDISNSSAGPVGNVKVGDVAIVNSGANAILDMSITNSGVGSAGNVTVGNITVTSGAGADDSITISNYAYAAGTKSATVGTTTVGNIAFTIGADTTAQASSLSVSITAQAYAEGTGTATVGDVSIGSVTASIGQSAYAQISVSVSAYSSAGAASVGNVSIGAATFNVALDAQLSYSVDVSATGNGGEAGTVGNVALGATTVTAGVGANYTGDNYVEANGSTGSSIGTVDLGSLVMNGDDGAYVYQYNYLYSGGTVGAVNFHDQSMTLGVSATGYVYNYVYGNQSVGDVSFGNETVDASKLNGYGYDYNLISSTAGSVGNVTVGNVTALAGKSASATYDLYVQGDKSVGTVAIGNVTSSAVGTSAYAEVYFNVTDSATGTIGNMSVGNVSMTANGAGAQDWFFAGRSNADAGGTLTVGNVAINIGNATKATGAVATFSVDNALGAVKIGNLALTASGVRSSTDTTIAYDATINITASTTVTMGNISVSGGDGKAENFGNFAANVMGGVSGTSITIGNVNYSGYGAAATIDVQGFKGAAAITGTAKGDTITDNKGTNALTGGTGADTFTFIHANTGVTLATMDSITDFGNATGDKMALTLLNALDPNTNYGENTFADFATFVTGANAANKEVFVGQIGADSIVAVDYDADGTVDFMVKLVGVGLAGVDVASFA